MPAKRKAKPKAKAKPQAKPKPKAKAKPKPKAKAKPKPKAKAKATAKPQAKAPLNVFKVTLHARDGLLKEKTDFIVLADSDTEARSKAIKHAKAGGWVIRHGNAFSADMLEYAEIEFVAKVDVL